MQSKMLETYNPRHIRGVACEMVKKYQDLAPEHVFWIAKKLMIYPDAKTYKNKDYVQTAAIRSQVGFRIIANTAGLTCEVSDG